MCKRKFVELTSYANPVKPQRANIAIAAHHLIKSDDENRSSADFKLCKYLPPVLPAADRAAQIINREL